MLISENWPTAKDMLSGLNFIQKSREAVKWYRLWGTMPVRSWIRGARSFKKEEFHTAIKHYNLGLEKQAGHPAAESARLDLAYCYYRVNQYDTALAQLDKLIQARVPLKEAYLLCARIQLILGRPLSAARTVHRCLEVFPHDLQALSCFFHTGLISNLPVEQLEDVRRHLYRVKSKMCIEDERNVHVDTALAHYEIRCGDLRKGERMLARVLSTGCAPFEAVLLRGERLLDQGRLMPAREQLTRAMKAAKKDPRPVMLLAKSYLRTGTEFKPDWALQLAETACRLSDWQNVECIGVLARAYEAKGENMTAELLHQRIEQLPSRKEINQSSFNPSLPQVRAQKVSNG